MQCTCIFYLKENQLSAFLKSWRNNLATAFSAVLNKNNITDWPASFLFIRKSSSIFFCHNRIEIRNLFLWLLLNNLLSVEMLFWNQLFCFKQVSPPCMHEDYSGTSLKIHSLFLNYFIVNLVVALGLWFFFIFNFWCLDIWIFLPVILHEKIISWYI